MPVPVSRRRFTQLCALGGSAAHVAGRTGTLCWLGALTTETVAPAAGSTLQDASGDDEPILPRLVRANDDLVRRLLPRQERRSGHRWLGGIPNEHGIHAVGAAAQFVSALVCASVAPASAYAGSPALVEPLHLATRSLLKAQHDDGTIDLHTTNFHSPPDTAFVLDLVAPAAALLASARRPADTGLQADLDAFIARAGEALVTGGIHTPNHRWVVCAALARVHARLPHPRLLARIDQWLDEGIDIDPDGQYAEKSTAVYSPIVDRCLLTMARLLDRPALRDPVRRNLEMTLYYAHPDGDVATEASLRQDRYQRGSLSRYYVPYRSLAIDEGNGRFAAMARAIEASAGSQLAGELPAFLEIPALQRDMPPSAPLPTHFVREFRHSGLARIRREQVSATILAGNPAFFSFRRGSAALEAVRVAAAFFGKGQFVGRELEGADGRYRLRQSLEGPYFQPVPKERLGAGSGHVGMEANGTLRVSPQAERSRSNVQTLETIVEIVGTDEAFTIAIAITGTDDVPVAVELAFRHGGRLTGVEAVPTTSDAFLLKERSGQFVHEGQTIEFGPGRMEHTWTSLRGAAPKWDGLSVYLTGFTPFAHTLHIR